MEQLIAVAGSLCVLAAFVAAQLGRMQVGGRVYIALNLIGSSVLATIAVLDQQWGFLLLEGVWAVVSAAGLLGTLGKPERRPRPGPAL